MSSFIGQMVHMLYRGRHMAAVITEFWEEQTVARLTVFDLGEPRVHARVEHGGVGDDMRWHTLEECPQVNFGPSAQTTQKPRTPRKTTKK